MKMDRWIFWGIWVLSALFWVITPAPNSYMNPSPLAPNHEVYPYSDAAGYDFQSQYALAGQGLNNGKATDNPMYPAFLVLVHLVSGQNYAANMAVQAAIYAFSVTYLFIGKKTFWTDSGNISSHNDHITRLQLNCRCFIDQSCQPQADADRFPNSNWNCAQYFGINNMGRQRA